MSRTEPNPAFLTYASDEIADSATRTHEQTGMFIVLRAQSWREQGLPTDHAELARRLGVTVKYFSKHAAAVLKPFREQDGRLVIPAQEEDRARAIEKSEKAKASAQARWGKDANALRTKGERIARAHENADANALRTECPAVAVAVAVATKKETTPPADSGFGFMGAFRDEWKRIYGGGIPKGSAKILKALVAEYGEEETLRRFRIYLDATEARFANVSRFGSTFGSWKEPKAATIEDPQLLAHAETLYRFYCERGFTRNVTLETVRENIKELVAEGAIEDGEAFYNELLAVKPWVLLRDSTKFDRPRHIAEIARLIRPTRKEAA